MRRALLLLLCLLSVSAYGVAKTHVIVLGKWKTVEWVPPTGALSRYFSVRPLFVDGKLREYIFGEPHDVTDRLFVVQRVFRLNDSLPSDGASAPRWTWQRGGWLNVDRLTGHISVIGLPGFDPTSYHAAWYRDYVAYCGTSDNGEKKYFFIVQLGRKKPVMKKEAPTACAEPEWQRNPARVTFAPAGAPPVTFQINAHGADPLPIENDDNDAKDEE